MSSMSLEKNQSCSKLLEIPECLRGYAIEEYLEYTSSKGWNITYDEYIKVRNEERRSFSEYLLRDQDTK